MRKSVIILTVFLFSAAIFAGVTKNELRGGFRYYYGLGGVTAPAEYMIPYDANELSYVNLPYAEYKIEMMVGKMFKVYVHPSIGYRMIKGATDGDVDDNHDRFGTEFYMSVKPMLKFYLPKKIFKMEGFFAKGALEIKTSSVTSQQINDISVDPAVRFQAVHVRTTDAELYAGFDNRKIDQHLLSPWDNFEKGWAAFLTYEEHLAKYIDGEPYISTEPRYIGLSGCYSHLIEKENMMVKLGMDYTYQLNADAGGKDTALDMNILFAYDVVKQFNAGATVNYTLYEPEFTVYDGEEEYTNFNYFGMGLNLNYYPFSIVEFTGGLDLLMDLTRADTDPEIRLEIGGAIVFK